MVVLPPSRGTTVCLLVSLLPFAANALEVPNVTLASGAVVMGASHADGTASYRGLRYATAQRFEKPIAWTYPPGMLIDGRATDRTSCWVSGGNGTEDCLFLDVSTPLNAEGVAVMVWIHGGGLFMGDKNQDGLYTPMHLNFVSEGGVATVSINYRLNVLGFLTGSGSDAPPANNGIRDQIAALEWVRDNIREFGGDTSRVTIFGNSAGALSVTVLHQSPLARGLFHRAIAMSPAWQNAALFHQPSAVVAESLAKKCLIQSGCDSADCLKTKRFSDVLRDCEDFFDPAKYISPIGAYFTGFDGEVLEASAYEKYCSGQLIASAEVPLIVGALIHEFRGFEPKGLSSTASIHKFFAEYVHGYVSSDADSQQCVRDIVLALYSNASALSTCRECGQFAGEEREMALAGDVEVMIGAQLAAASLGGARYRYLFDVEGDGSLFGSSHASDLNYFFQDPGENEENIADNSTREDQKELGRMFREYFFTFARHGVPSSSRGPVWEPVDPAQGAVALPLLHLRLGGDATAMESEPWFNRVSAALLSDIACGRIGSSDFRDCRAGGRQPPPVAMEAAAVAAAVLLLIGVTALCYGCSQKRGSRPDPLVAEDWREVSLQPSS